MIPLRLHAYFLSHAASFFGISGRMWERRLLTSAFFFLAPGIRACPIPPLLAGAGWGGLSVASGYRHGEACQILSAIAKPRLLHGRAENAHPVMVYVGKYTAVLFSAILVPRLFWKLAFLRRTEKYLRPYTRNFRNRKWRGKRRGRGVTFYFRTFSVPRPF